MSEEVDEPRWLLTVEGGMLEAIGRATVHFAHLENELDQFIWSLVAGFDVVTAANDADGARKSFDAQKIGQAITARAMFRGKVEMMVSLATERFAKDSNTMTLIETLRQGLEGAAKHRNRLVHAVWSGSAGGSFATPPGTALSAKVVHEKKAGMRLNIAVHTQEDVAELADTFSKLSFALARARAQVLSNSSAGADEHTA